MYKCWFFSLNTWCSSVKKPSENSVRRKLWLSSLTCLLHSNINNFTTGRFWYYLSSLGWCFIALQQMWNLSWEIIYIYTQNSLKNGKYSLVLSCSAAGSRSIVLGVKPYHVVGIVPPWRSLYTSIAIQNKNYISLLFCLFLKLLKINLASPMVSYLSFVCILSLIKV